MEEQSPRLTTGSSAVYQRFISGTRSALSSWLPTSGTTLVCLCKLLSCKACPGEKKGYSKAKAKASTTLSIAYTPSVGS